MSLTKLALKRPVSIAMIILALVVFGLTSVAGFRLELTPDMELPMLLVYTIYPGADPESVEELVTKEVESAGSEQSGVTTYTSQSAENMSMVMFQYEYGTDLKDAYMGLSNRSLFLPRISPAITARFACSRESNSPCWTNNTSTRSFFIIPFLI